MFWEPFLLSCIDLESVVLVLDFLVMTEIAYEIWKKKKKKKTFLEFWKCIFHHNFLPPVVIVGLLYLWDGGVKLKHQVFYTILQRIVKIFNSYIISGLESRTF